MSTQRYDITNDNGAMLVLRRIGGVGNIATDVVWDIETLAGERILRTRDYDKAMRVVELIEPR